MHNHTKESLIAFEDRVADAFRRRQIRAPVHLCGGNEEQLIDIFKDVRPGDWVFSSWRSTYHALLKGIPEEWVFNEIMAGRSMFLMNKEHRFLCSAIVGGVLPIAVGVALAIKRQPPEVVAGESPPQVWVFAGDMTATTGLFHEATQYAVGNDLPLHIVVEDNGFSTDTPTAEAWGKVLVDGRYWVDAYKYTRTRPHVGIGEHVAF